MVCTCVAMVAWACAQDVSGLMEYLEGLCDTCFISDDTKQPLLMLPRPKPTQATTWHSCTGQAGFQITLAYPELTKLQTRQACAGLSHTNLILDFITGQAWMTFKHHCFQMPPVVTDYKGEINLTAYGINNPDTNNLPGLRADHGL